VPFIDIGAVLNSVFLIIVSPAGKSSHIKLGIAAASKKPIYVFDSNNETGNFTKTGTFYIFKKCN
jgi:hypothetical protein